MRITREDITSCHLKYLRKGKPWQPDVSLIKKDGCLIVVKDYSPRDFSYRVGVGIWSVWRESLIYSKLHDLEGVPWFYGRIDRYAIAIEYIEGSTASVFKRGELPASFFERLTQLVQAVHDRNIVLCDMRNNKNVIVTANSHPVILDFVSAFQKGWRVNILKNFIYNIFIQDDFMGIAKLKKKLAPELLGKDEAEKLENGLFMQKEAIFVRDIIRKYLKKLVHS